MVDGHSPWAVGDRLWARDRCFKWYWSSVVEADGEGADQHLRIHFGGWSARYDERIRADSRRLRAKPPEEDENEASDTDDSGDEEEHDGHVGGSQWTVDKLVAKRLDEDGEPWYKVRWQGCSKKDDQWRHHRHIADDLIDEFEEARASRAPAARARREATPAVPFCLLAENTPSEMLLPLLRPLAKTWLDKVSRRSAKLLAKMKRPYPRRKLLSGQVCPPQMFVAVHALLLEEASTLAGSISEHVTDIKPLKGQRTGDLVQDTFTIKTHAMITRLLERFRVGPGAGAIVYLKSNTAVGLLAPLKFTFTTRRSSPDPELSVTGNFGTLVKAAGPRYEPTFRFGNVAITPATRQIWEIALSADVLTHASSGAKPKVQPHLEQWLRNRMQQYAAGSS